MLRSTFIRVTKRKPTSPHYVKTVPLLHYGRKRQKYRDFI